MREKTAMMVKKTSKDQEQIAIVSDILILL